MRLTSHFVLAFALSCVASQVAAQTAEPVVVAPAVSADPRDPASRAEEVPSQVTPEGAPANVSPDAAAASVETVMVQAPGVEEAQTESSSGFRGFLQDNVAIHGFGTFQAGLTRSPNNPDSMGRDSVKNHYQFGDVNGDLQHLNFSLRELVQPVPELRLFAGQSFSYVDGALLVELDLAGAQWTPKRWFAFRVGRILSPVGIYTEIYRVGTLRPFGNLPTSIYGNAGFIAQSYDGGELQFTLDTDSGWSARFSAFAGHSYISQDQAIGITLEGLTKGLVPYGTVRTDLELELMYGGNVRVDTPIEGLGFAFGVMGSQKNFTNVIADNNLFKIEENNLELIGSAYYLRDKFELRGEFAYRRNHNRDSGNTLLTAYGLYVEAAYRPIERVQLAIRYERYDSDVINLFPLGKYASVLRQDDVGGVVSYWFTRDFVLKFEYHFIDGNRFAHPHGPALYTAVMEDRNLSKRTHFIGFTSSFSF